MTAVHASGVANPNWPLCVEAEARGQGWTVGEIEDGELVDDPTIRGEGLDAWWSAAPVDCSSCLELVHA